MDSQFRPTGFSILPNVVKNLLIINGIFFLATIAGDYVWHIDLADYLGLHYIGASDFRPYQFVTYMFMHGSFAHIFFNMFALWMFGNTLENAWGPKKFLAFYFVCGIGAGITQELVQYIQVSTEFQQYMFADNGVEYIRLSDGVVRMSEFMNRYTTVGASGAVYGILLAFGIMWPNSRIYIYFAIPIKAKWFVVIYGLLELFSGFTSMDNVAHFAHVGGMLFGLALILYWRHKYNGWNPFKSRKDKYYDTYAKTYKNDWDYNKQRSDDDRRTDEILDKISKGGYDSLTQEEKEFLFKQSKKN